LALLIQMFGLFYPPRGWGEGSGYVTSDMRMSDLINGMINKLSISVSEDATYELQNLLKIEKLNMWHQSLQGALYQQLANKREADFSHPDVTQVKGTLNNLAPANVADLAAIAIDHIRDLANQIRNSNTDDYKQYWNLDSYAKPITRRHEDACRDTFLSDLKIRLVPLNIEANPEGHYADDTRTDIKLSYGGKNEFNVPIEIKCNDHKDLWYSIHDQLIKKYTRDPGAHGHGIYLVFWFGSEETTMPPSGQRPKTAKELQSRLYETLTTKEEHQQISICVIDCSKPHNS